ncbi:MAG: hypothetical protein NTW19_11000 [Planctomycetota bacterium]|nr:hypothetical protein [Planctomycetota bacterium]
MTWTSMHFAVGMACAGGITAVGCAIPRRGWRWIPAAMTLGGLWANVPDMPRLFRQDFPGLHLASTLGSLDLEHFLHRWGDLFFFHATLDDCINDYALHGLIGMIFLYNLAIGLMLFLEHRQRRLVHGHAGHAPPRPHRPRAAVPRPMPAAKSVSPENDVEADDGETDPIVRLVRSSHLSRR